MGLLQPTVKCKMIDSPVGSTGREALWVLPDDTWIPVDAVASVDSLHAVVRRTRFTWLNSRLADLPCQAAPSSEMAFEEMRIGMVENRNSAVPPLTRRLPGQMGVHVPRIRRPLDVDATSRD